MKHRLGVLLLGVCVAFPVSALEPVKAFVVGKGIDRNHVAVVVNELEEMQTRFVKTQRNHFLDWDSSFVKKKEWYTNREYNYRFAEILFDLRTRVAAALQDPKEWKIVASDGTTPAIASLGYWVMPHGQVQLKDFSTGKLRMSRNADVAHCVYLTLDAPMRENVSYEFQLPTGQSITIPFSDQTTRSSLFKYDQVGYSPRANRKYAYMGLWQGDAGALDLSEYIGKNFTIRNAADGAVVYTNTIAKRAIQDKLSPNGGPVTGEMVLELIFSDFSTPGEYYFQVDGVGRSGDFKISEQGLANAFQTHMNGLYLQRCGSAKEEPYTHWTQGRCHMQSYQGQFPPNVEHYNKAKEKDAGRDWGFFDENGTSISAKQFTVMKWNPGDDTKPLDVHGGWHDAADFDRRNLHYRVVNDLLCVYLMAPGNFRDGQLNIPEKANGVADIIDEALYGMEAFRLSQQPSGAVTGWIEATSHPDELDASRDQQHYYLALATRESTLEFAGYASLAALALRENGQPQLQKVYQEAAEKAWRYAQNPANRVVREYDYEIDKRKQKITYRESATLPIHLEALAAVNLLELTGDERYLDSILPRQEELLEEINNLGWRYMQLQFGSLAIFGAKHPKLLPFYYRLQRVALKLGAEHLEWLNTSYPYRIPWYPAEHGFAKYMSWGNFHPMRRGLIFILADYFSPGTTRFRDAAYLAANFHNGANAQGMTMTSGLGEIYPVRFLNLHSIVDDIAEYIPGITPYFNTYGIPREDILLAHTLYYPEKKDNHFEAHIASLMPKVIPATTPLDPDVWAKAIGKAWPIWHRFPNVESLTVAASEYTVNETIGPAAALAGWLLDGPRAADPAVIERQPASDLRQLPGYSALP